MKEYLLIRFSDIEYGKVFWYQFPSKEIANNKERFILPPILKDKLRPVVIVSSSNRHYQPVFVCPTTTQEPKNDKDRNYKLE